MLAHGRKYLKIGPYGLAASGVIVVAVCIRVILLRMGWPATNSDEATMGLMARHIAYNGEHPVFIYGQNYMGSLEAYIGAALFFIFGSSLFSLRLSLVLLYALFLVAMYLLTRLLYSEKLALAVTVLFSLGSVELLTRQLKAVGGAVETMLFGTLLILLSSQLVLSFHQNMTTAGRKKRWLLYGCFGLVTGLGMWSHMLILPFVVVSLALLIFFCCQELRISKFASFLLGFILGFSPALSFNIRHPAQNSLGALWQLHNSGGTATTIPFTLWDSIRGTVLVSLPMATGVSPQCPVPDTPGVWRTHITSCMLTQSLWSVGFLLLYMFVLLGTVYDLVKYYQRTRATAVSDEERRIMMYNAARLTLLLGGGLTLLAYVFSPAPALVPLTSTRYLVGLLIMFPALLSPLWKSVRQLQVALMKQSTQRSYFALMGNICRGVVLLLLYGIYFMVLVGVFQQVPATQATNQQQYKMVDDLLHAHITRFYSDYWTCNRVIFQSNEQLICSVLNEKLQSQDNRYPRYQTIVEHYAQTAYVFPINSSQAITMAHQVAQSGQRYERVEMDGYVIYKPV